ncbi:hypothetical protein ABIF96_005821 [Bradyrhizobium ottawaense]|uniref:hypothetical protein n=1 Tax=Bradyrhizobium ottawaense TaxID=931866 RepID=UPI003837F096
MAMRDWNGKAEPFQIHDAGWALIFLIIMLAGATVLIHWRTSMSGAPFWLGSAIGKEILIDGKKTILRDGYCVSCRIGVPNSDELVLVTDAGSFNTHDHEWDFYPKNAASLSGPATEE